MNGGFSPFSSWNDPEVEFLDAKDLNFQTGKARSYKLLDTIVLRFSANDPDDECRDKARSDKLLDTILFRCTT